MLDKMENFLEEGRLDKAQRWLGFIQGCLLCAGGNTLDDLKHHSMTGGEESPHHSTKLSAFYFK